MRTWLFILIGLTLLLFGHGKGPFREVDKDAMAYEASSSSFFLHGGGVDSIAKTGSSSSFIEHSAGGQAITGVASSSTSFISFKGIINLIFRSFTPKYEQIHYHWRHDDNTEALATSMTSGTQDTVISGLAKNTVKRLRFEISNEGGQDSISAQQFRVEYKLKSGDCATGVYTDVGAVGGDWDMGASQLTEAGDATNIAVAIGGVTDENNSFIGTNGGQRETTSQTGNITVYNNQFVELEYAVQALSDATDEAAYCFRLTNAGSATNFTYTKYPEATLAAAAASVTLTIDGTCNNDNTCDLDATAQFGTLSVGTANDANVRVKTDSNTTVLLAIGRKRSSPTTTLASSADAANINISDTAGGIDVFDSNCTDGTGPATWGNAVSTGLGFSLWAATENKDTTCWGTGTTDSDANNKYAALQASLSASTAWTTTSSGIKYASVGYTLDIITNQRATSYTGDIIFTATTTP
ncbi:MAG: hypothetical protein A2655_03885 [Candidatus Yanofskybacteria bacterium RIFCSPHIGHO2_01_FULL_43_42]|uniref:Uncharacterized protein n=1 Tax=Candidatus Yanofskybacteria bacterium RIFCSPLOWO2_01_FULL_43_22 TaxID=1802695 RepID=A0A1F8GI30_9BACT|nr:MAG: hypothetical protein A2655_03885 [Candidatus Yanofskybacteria bacterium RIFCSPHIGHO2_01_FULL_43_42]OGN13880.1 MAG: hypothetical protein A3D48_00015 [Candidatus Yanofskybacteria bacterium RIFCSPHIGHO2_02_FULL_43_17]OGN25057.1 MAG: hypothetical protein A3A13_03320 [Candidatus Yanofskybacteria bacterium RIFCSPLOWO2_01_FULL_43_22]